MSDKQSWYSITARAEGLVTDIFIYDEIGGFGITAKDFVQDLAAHKDSELVVRINSPGGDVFEGLAIFNALANHKPHVECRVDGLAASMASVIALAGDITTIAATGTLMIHDPSGLVMGRADDMRDMAMTLDKLRDTIAGVYAGKTKRPRAEILDAMKGERWFTATEAKDFGLVDNISAPLKAAACFDLSRFQNVPHELRSQAKMDDAFRRENEQLQAEIQRLQVMAQTVTASDPIPPTFRRNENTLEARFAAFQDRLTKATTAWGRNR